MQETSKNSENIDQIIKARKFARDIYKAVKSSPENVTADQIDLLIEKQKLIKKKLGTLEVDDYIEAQELSEKENRDVKT